MGRRVVSWNHQHGTPVAVLEDQTFWQPLLDNSITDAAGDAFRLAVKLGIGVEFAAGCVAAYSGSKCARQFTERHNTHAADREEATRRAIVRAAASLAE
jgi:hypothetical protein